MKNPFVQKTYKPLLHKKGKQWIVLGLSGLTLLGLGSAFDLNANASTNTIKSNINHNLQTKSATNLSNNQQNKPATQTISYQANQLHNRIVANQAKYQKASNISSNSNSSTYNALNSNKATNSTSNKANSSASNSVSSSSNTTNTLHLGTPTQQKRGWNFIQHGVNNNDFDKTNTVNSNASKTTTNSNVNNTTQSSNFTNPNISNSSVNASNISSNTSASAMKVSFSEVASDNKVDVSSDKKLGATENVNEPQVKDNNSDETTVPKFDSSKVVASGKIADPGTVNWVDTGSTAKWSLDDNGELLIHDGTMSDNTGWTACCVPSSVRSQVKYVTFKNTVIKHGFGLAQLPNVKVIDFSGLNPSTPTNNSITSGSGKNSFAGAFFEDSNLVTINFGHNLDTSSITSDTGSFFSEDSRLKNLINFQNCNWNNLTDTNDFFYGDTSLTSLDLSSFNTSNARNNNKGGASGNTNGLSGFIGNCPNLRHLKLGPNTILTSQAINGDPTKSNALNNGVPMQLADGQPHPGTWTLLQGVKAEAKWGKQPGAANVFLNDNGDLYLTNGSITNNRNDVTGSGWNNNMWSSVKHIYTSNVNSGAILSQMTEHQTGLFQNLHNLIDVDLSGLNASQSADMANMFGSDSSLQNVKFNNTFKSIYEIGGAFESDSDLQELDLSPFGNLSSNGLMGVKDNSLQTVVLGQSTRLSTKLHNQSLPSNTHWINLNSDTPKSANASDLENGQAHPGTWTRNAEIVNLQHDGKTLKSELVKGNFKSTDNTNDISLSVPMGYAVGANQTITYQGGTTNINIYPTDHVRFEDNATGDFIADEPVQETQSDETNGDNWIASKHPSDIPEGYSLPSNSTQQFTFGKADDNSIQADGNIYHIIKLVNNSSTIPVTERAVDIDGSATLHFRNKAGNSEIAKIPVNFLESSYPQSDTNLLKGTSYANGNANYTPSDLINAIGNININGKNINPSQFKFSGSTNDYHYQPNQNDVKSYHESTPILYKNIDLYFNEKGNANESVQYTYNGSNVSSSFNISGSDNASETDSAVAHNANNLPTGYNLANSNANIFINNGSADVPLVQSKVADTVNFTNGSQGSTTSGNYFSDIQPDEINNIPNGYHLASNATSQFGGHNNNTISINVAPNTEHEDINFYYNHSGKNVLAGHAYIQGNYGSTSDITSANASNYGLNSDYSLVNKDNRFTFGSNGDTINIAVTPKQKEAEAQFVTTSGSDIGNAMTSLGNGNPSDTMNVGSGQLSAPTNYHIVNPSQVLHYNNHVSDIVVAPNNITEHIKFSYSDGKGNTKTSSDTMTGAYNSNGTFAGASNMPKGYHIANDGSANFKFGDTNNDTHTVNLAKDASDSVIGVAKIKTVYNIKGHPNQTKYTYHYIPISGHIVPSDDNNGADNIAISPFEHDFQKTGFVQNNSDTPLVFKFTPNFVKAHSLNGDKNRFNINTTFTYTATPVDVRVKFTDTDNNNKQVKSDDLGEIGIPGQPIDIQDDNNGKIDALTGEGLFTNNTSFNLPDGYRLENANNIMTIEPTTDSNGQISKDNQGYPIMLLSLNLGSVNNTPVTPNKPNKPSNNNGGNVTPNKPSNNTNNNGNNNVISINNNAPIVPSDISSNSNNHVSPSTNNKPTKPSNNNIIINPNVPNIPGNNKPSNNNINSKPINTPVHHHNIQTIHNIKNLINVVKPNQVVNYKGIKVVNITTDHKLPYYIYNIKNILLHKDINNPNGIKTRRYSGFTGKILREFKINNKARFLVRWNAHDYFVTARNDYVRNAYIQPSEFKAVAKGVIKHATIKLRKNARIYNSIHFTNNHFKRNIKAGSKVNVVGIKNFGQKGYKRTRFVLSNGLIITANKNYVKFI